LFHSLNGAFTLHCTLYTIGLLTCVTLAGRCLFARGRYRFLYFDFINSYSTGQSLFLITRWCYLHCLVASLHFCLAAYRFIFLSCVCLVTLRLSSRFCAGVNVTSCARDFNFLKEKKLLFFTWNFFSGSFMFPTLCPYFMGMKEFVTRGDLLQI